MTATGSGSPERLFKTQLHVDGSLRCRDGGATVLEDVNLPRDEVKEFLQRLQTHLGTVLANRQDVIDTVTERARKNKGGKDFEAALVEEFILKALHGLLAQSETQYLDGRQPRDVILAESVRARREKAYAAGSPVRTPGHPFQKAIAARAEKIFSRWQGGELNQRKSAVGQVCPDVALISPYRVVFECKYFKTAGLQIAKAALVEGLYEAFFYRAMPRQARSMKHGAGWDYEYACFLAYDATPNHRLVNAWNAVKERVEENFWDDGNIFVMIFPTTLP